VLRLRLTPACLPSRETGGFGGAMLCILSSNQLHAMSSLLCSNAAGLPHMHSGAIAVYLFICSGAIAVFTHRPSPLFCMISLLHHFSAIWHAIWHHI
jgi:hypothetical protein